MKTPGTNVFLDNVQINNSDLLNRLTVASGGHLILATKEGFSTYKSSFTISKGELKTFIITLILNDQETSYVFSNTESKKDEKLINESQTTSNEDLEAEPFIVVEEMPIFPGGEAALLKWIAEHTNYPEIAKENNIQGRVIIRFCITAKGTINQVIAR